MKQFRELKKIIKGKQISDGDGVQLTRIIGIEELDMLDPFLLMDAFGSDKPQDYIGGFPPHPHRGFETVTYMLAGKMKHQDSAGNAGIIEAGDVQWMRAGKGVIHSEMPQQEQGLLSGIQLWVNLPAAHKMDDPEYQEVMQDQIPVHPRSETCRIKVIAGTTKEGIQGPVKSNFVEAIFWDINLTHGAQFIDAIPPGHNAFIYVIDGSLNFAEQGLPLLKHELGVLDMGKEIKITALSDSRFLLIAGKPINQPVARGGPFVMNTQDEIKQAFSDYQTGRLAQEIL